MSVNFPTFYVQQYSTNIELLLQDRGSKLRNLVMSGSHVGKQASPVDQIGAIAAKKRTTRFAAMPRVDAPTDRRWVYPNDWDLPQLIDSLDKLRMLTDPESAYVINAVYALGREFDNEIIAAFFRAAKTGENGATSTSFPAGQVVAVNEGAASATGLTVEKLRAAKEILMANEVDLEADPLIVPITAKQHDNLLGQIQVVSRDYNDRLVLVDGKVQSYMGFQFVHKEGLALDSNSYRRVPAYAKSGMYLGLWEDIGTSISTRHDLTGEPWQAYATATFGATRLEEKKVVEIKCAE